MRCVLAGDYAAGPSYLDERNGGAPPRPWALYSRNLRSLALVNPCCLTFVWLPQLCHSTLQQTKLEKARPSLAAPWVSMGACDVARHLRNVAERRNRNPREHTMRRQGVFVDYYDRNATSCQKNHHSNF